MAQYPIICANCDRAINGPSDDYLGRCRNCYEEMQRRYFCRFSSNGYSAYQDYEGQQTNFTRYHRISSLRSSSEYAIVTYLKELIDGQ